MMGYGWSERDEFFRLFGKARQSRYEAGAAALLPPPACP